MSLWPLFLYLAVVPGGFVLLMVGIGLGWWPLHRDHTLDSIDEFDDWRTALRGDQ
jgi:hypothetical protein